MKGKSQKLGLFFQGFIECYLAVSPVIKRPFAGAGNPHQAFFKHLFPGHRKAESIDDLVDQNRSSNSKRDGFFANPFSNKKGRTGIPVSGGVPLTI